MQTKQRSRKWLWILICLGVVIVAGLGLWFSGNLPGGFNSARAGGQDSTALAAGEEADRDDDEPEEIPVPVELACVEKRAIAAFYRSASVIEADRMVDLVAKVTGRVQSINVEEGDWVGKGDVLAELENGRERIQLRQAELKLIEQQRLLARQEAMLDEELISRQVYDDAKHAFDLAETDRDLARIALEETIIRAPFAGQVTDRQIVLGQQVAVAAPLFTLADFQPLRVRVHLPEAIARKVSPGQRVLVSPEVVVEPLPAVVERISPVVDPATSTVRLTLLLADGCEQARVGGFVKVRITTDSHLDAMAIPKIALVEEGGLRSVFVAEADSVRKVEINTGLYDETYVEVLDGLAEGEFVVTLGQGNLRTGSLVEPLNGEAVGWPAAAPADSTGAGDDAAEVALSPDS